MLSLSWGLYLSFGFRRCPKTHYREPLSKISSKLDARALMLQEVTVSIGVD